MPLAFLGFAAPQLVEVSLCPAGHAARVHLLGGHRWQVEELLAAVRQHVDLIVVLAVREAQQLTLELEKQLETVKRGRFEQRNQQITRVFDDYRQWVQDTLTTEPQPWIQVPAAVCHPQAALAATAGA